MTNKIQAIQKLMQQNNIDLLWISDADPHFNEYVHPHWQLRSYLSGFDGSNGVLIIEKDAASLWTDGRYFVQAKSQLEGSNIKMCKWESKDKSPVNYLINKSQKENLNIGYDPKVLSSDFIYNITNNVNSKLIPLDNNFIEKLWSADKNTKRAKAPMDKIKVYPIKYAGESFKDKVDKIKSKLDTKVSYYLLSRSDQIAWLLNLRGNDTKHTPIFMAYALISFDKNKNSVLWVLEEKITQDVKDYCKQNKIDLKNYANFEDDLKSIDFLDIDKVLYESANISKACFDSLNIKDTNKICDTNLTLDKIKASKNKVQQDGMRKAHLLDGIALVKGIYALEQDWQILDEFSAASVINNARLSNKSCLDLSFETISSTGSNAAIIHYSPKEGSSKKLSNKHLYLLDSGGQYLDGTTDVTRVLNLGEDKSNIQDRWRKFYTLVLKGNLALANEEFAYGTTGKQLDILARKFLHEHGADFAHGTGHGVGSYLCVHEGPQCISPRGSDIPLEEGMVVSNEPGVYFEGDFGIRIEDLLLVVKSEKSGFLKFEKLTLFPYEKNLIDTNLLSTDEISQINLYHKHIYAKLAGSVDDNYKKWLKNKLELIN